MNIHLTGHSSYLWYFALFVKCRFSTTKFRNAPVSYQTKEKCVIHIYTCGHFNMAFSGSTLGNSSVFLERYRTFTKISFSQVLVCGYVTLFFMLQVRDHFRGWYDDVFTFNTTFIFKVRLQMIKNVSFQHNFYLRKSF